MNFQPRPGINSFVMIPGEFQMAQNDRPYPPPTGYDGLTFTSSDVFSPITHSGGSAGAALGATSVSAVTNASGLQIFNVSLGSAPPGCSTSGLAGGTCTTGPLNLPIAEPDTNYRVTCTGKGPVGVPVISDVTNSSPMQFTISIAALTDSTASFASADCIVGHN